MVNFSSWFDRLCTLVNFVRLQWVLITLFYVHYYIYFYVVPEPNQLVFQPGGLF